MKYFRLIPPLLLILCVAIIEKMTGLPLLTVMVGMTVIPKKELPRQLVVMTWMTWIIASIFMISWVGSTLLVVAAALWSVFGNLLIPSKLTRQLILIFAIGGMSQLLLHQWPTLFLVIYELIVMVGVVIFSKGVKLWQVRKQYTIS